LFINTTRVLTLKVVTLTGVRTGQYEIRPTLRLPRQRRRDSNGMQTDAVFKPHYFVFFRFSRPAAVIAATQAPYDSTKIKKRQIPVFHQVTLDFASMLPEAGGYAVCGLFPSP